MINLKGQVCEINYGFFNPPILRINLHQGLDKFFSANTLLFRIFSMADKEIVIATISREGAGLEDRWILPNLIGYSLIWSFSDDCDRSVDDDIRGLGLARGIRELKTWRLLTTNSGRKMQPIRISIICSSFWSLEILQLARHRFFFAMRMIPSRPLLFQR